MGFWEAQVVPRFVNVVLDTGEVRKFRSQALQGLDGRVLEIGFGSGLNVPHYPSEMSKVMAVDPSGVGRRLSSKRVAASPCDVTFVGLDGQEIPLESGSVDNALSTFTLCTIPDVSKALGEVLRVLKPGGRFHFLEHGLSPVAGVASWQKRLEPIQKRIGGGCHLSRPIGTLVEDAGFEVETMRNDQMRGPSFLKPFGYLYIGVATKPAQQPAQA